MNRDPGCVFCRIIAGEVPSLKVFEDDASFAFLDIGPLADGHLLLVPKDHHERLEAMTPDAVASVARNLPRLARAALAVTGDEAYNILLNVGKAAGQEVAHAHFHIIPRQVGDGLGYRWAAKKYSAGFGERIAEQIRAALASDK
jgi:histidine triad (HIT) family protein